MVALPSSTPVERTPIELQARTLAASCLCEVGIDRTPEAMDYLTEFILDKAAMGAAVWHEAHKASVEGSASLAEKLAKLKQKYEPPGD